LVSHRPSARHNGPSPQILRALLRLRELIITGALPPGKRVPELQLVGSTGVSRTPLRIAMERLEHEGLLERRPRGGFVVRAFTQIEIEHAIEARGVLEGAAARTAAERGVDDAGRDALADLIARLDIVVAELPAMQAFEQYVQLNEDLHQTIVNQSGNDMLRKLLAQVGALPFASPSAFVLIHASTPQSVEILRIAQDQHRTLVEAIERREGARAEGIAREHARLALRNLRAVIHDRERFGRAPGAALVMPG
jgi:GntR family transcriptional regulator of vanillate catabolism